MSISAEILELLPRARDGDDKAWTRLVAILEPFLLRVARTRLRLHARSDQIRRDFASSDICQSVFRSFLKGLRTDRFQISNPEDLERLLQVMARFNVAAKARRAHYRLRGLLHDFDLEAEELVEDGITPEQVVEDRDLVESVQAELTQEELFLLMLYLEGSSWAEVAKYTRTTADAVRMRIKRAIQRVREKMGKECA